MGLDQLLAALEREAQAEADRLIADARAAAEASTARSDARIAARRGERLGTREAAQEGELQAALAAARLAARRRSLVARDTLLGRVFAAARRLCAEVVPTPAHLASLPPRVDRALACFAPGTSLTIAAPPELVPHLARMISAPDTITMLPDRDVGSGFRVRSADGTLEVTDTLEDRLVAERPALSRRALELLKVAS